MDMSIMAPQSCTLQQLIRLTSDTIAEILDTYRTQNQGVPDTIRPLILQDVKTLLVTLEQYEKQIASISTSALGVTVSPLPNTKNLLDDCGLLGKRLLIKIKRNALRDDGNTRREIFLLNDAVLKLLVQDSAPDDFPEPLPHAPDPPVTDSSENWPARTRPMRAETPVARSPRSGSEYTSSPNDDLEADDLRSTLDGLMRENEALRANDQSKLDQIKTLYAAIKDLNARHPMRHRLNSWEELTDELPHLIDHIESANELLKDLENGSRSTTSSARPPRNDPPTRRGGEETSSTRSRRHPNMRPEPPSPVAHSSSNEVAVRSPSPTDSNFSTARTSDTRIRNGHRGDNRRSAVPERRGLWNR